MLSSLMSWARGRSTNDLEVSRLANGDFVVLDERDSDLGRVKVAVREDFGDEYLVECPDRDRK